MIRVSINDALSSIHYEQSEFKFSVELNIVAKF